MHPHDFKPRPGRFAPGAIGHTRGVVRPNYAVMPPEGILDSLLPDYEKTIVNFQAAPVLGARFAQAMLRIAPGGGTRDTLRHRVQNFFYVLSGQVEIAIDGTKGQLKPEGFAYVPPETPFSLRNAGPEEARVIMLKKPYEPIHLDAPLPIISQRSALEKINHNNTEGRSWEHCLGFNDLRFDMEINILSFAPGTHFPDVETHIMEHGRYMLEGQGMYLLGSDWHEVWEGDFIWMGSYCPQFYYPTGWTPSAYLLYKDVNRDISF